jgi:hypothetical protein
MKLSSKLGQSLGLATKNLAIKKIQVSIGETSFELKVKIPLKKEIEDINAKILTPDPAKVEAIYQKITKPLMETIKDGGEKFLEALNEKKQTITVLEDDLIVDGNSLKQIASYQAIDEARIEEYFHLLISEIDEPITESYDEIMQEFPEFVVREILNQIQAAIHPDYSTAKKN